MKKAYAQTIRTLLIALTMLVAAVFTAQSALASTAANTVITNTVDVTYADALGNAQAPVSDTADVTVQLVAAAPDLSSPANTSVTQGGTVDLTYTITGNANGNDTYKLDTAAVAANVAGASWVFRNAGDTADITDIPLGGTTLAAATDGTSTITVPYDGNNDGFVNGIAEGATIDIAGAIYTVATSGITETPATNTATILLTANVPSGTAAGSIVGEQASFILRLTAGAVGDPLVASNYQVTTTGTAQNGVGPAGSQAAATQVDVTVGALSVTKEVSTDGGSTWAASANANPGITLTYRITVENTGSGDATNVVITDDEPQFTAYAVNSGESSTVNGANYGDAGNTTLTDAIDGDGYDWNLTTAGQVTFSAGTISAGNFAVLFFQVDVQ